MISSSMALSSTGIAGAEEVPAELFVVSATETLKGGCSPVYSDTGSSDSGILGNFAEEDHFLAGLFGSEYPLLSSAVDSAGSPPLFSLAGVTMPEVSRSEVPQEQPHANVMKPEEDSISETQLERNRRNAEQARQHRQRKKVRLEGLEKERIGLKAENVVLKTRCEELKATVRKMESEVHYLKSVLANQSTLASLIQNIPTTPGVRLTSSFPRKRPNEVSTSEVAQKAKRSRREAPSTGGVCLHVSQDVVSLEFCHHCSQQAAETAQS